MSWTSSRHLSYLLAIITKLFSLNSSKLLTIRLPKNVELSGREGSYIITSIPLDLIRVIISRNEIDMPQIKQYYKNLFNKDLVQDIKGDTSGNYQKILVELATH